MHVVNFQSFFESAFSCARVGKLSPMPVWESSYGERQGYKFGAVGQTSTCSTDHKRSRCRQFSQYRRRLRRIYNDGLAIPVHKVGVVVSQHGDLDEFDH